MKSASRRLVRRRIWTMIIVILLLIGIDQYTKFLAEKHLAGKPSLVLIPGVLELKYLENRGMALGMFQGKVLLFTLICVVFFIGVSYLICRIPKTPYYLPLLSVLLFLCGGGAGNFLDRVMRGYVVDFIYIALVDFPVFNFADIYVVCSVIALLLVVNLKYRDEDFYFLYPKRRG